MEQILQDKEKERMVLWTKVEALTRQLEELLRGDTSTSYINCHINTFGNNGKIELERLRQKLLYCTKLTEQQSQELAHKRVLYSQRQAEEAQIDKRICDLRQRLARKRQLNQQLSMQAALHRVNNADNNSALGRHNGNNVLLRRSVGHPIDHKSMSMLRSISANVSGVAPISVNTLPRGQTFVSVNSKMQQQQSAPQLHPNQHPSQTTLPVMNSREYAESKRGTATSHSRATSFSQQHVGRDRSENEPNLNGHSTIAVIGNELTSSTSSLSSSQSQSVSQQTNSDIKSIINANSDVSSLSEDINLNCEPFSTSAKANNQIVFENNVKNKGENKPENLNCVINFNNSNNSNGYVDWHKVKRRPVIADNEIEKALEIQMQLPGVKSAPESNVITNTSPALLTSLHHQQRQQEVRHSQPKSGSQLRHLQHQFQPKPQKAEVPNSDKLLGEKQDFHSMQRYSTTPYQQETNAPQQSKPAYKSLPQPQQPNVPNVDKVLNEKAVNHMHQPPLNALSQQQTQQVQKPGLKPKPQIHPQLLLQLQQQQQQSLSDKLLGENHIHHQQQQQDQNRLLHTKSPVKPLPQIYQQETGGKSQGENNIQSEAQQQRKQQRDKEIKVFDEVTDNNKKEIIFEQISESQENHVNNNSVNANNNFNILTTNVTAQATGEQLKECNNNEDNNRSDISGCEVDHVNVEQTRLFADETSLLHSHLANKSPGVVGAKRIKSVLKNQKQQQEHNECYKGDKNANSTSANANQRRVSFDPLALLLDAALEGELELVKKTASEVPNPSAANDEGITALHNAICAGHFEIVKYLVEFGCDVNARDSDGWTPLHCAASCNNLAMVKLLVQTGACIFATTLSDIESAAEKCEEDEEGFQECSKYLYGIQEQLGVVNGGAVYAVYNYDAQNPDELSFREGDKIIVLRKGDEQERDWWWSRLRDREGYVPRNLLGITKKQRSILNNNAK